MSLINQALKKAQNDRSNARPEAENPSSPPLIAPNNQAPMQQRPSSGISPGLIIGLVIGLFVVVAALLILVIVLVLRPTNSSPKLAETSTPIISEQLTPKQTPISQDQNQQQSAESRQKAETNLAEQLKVARETAEAKAKAEAKVLVETKALAEIAAQKEKAEAEALAAAEVKREEEAKLKAFTEMKAAEEAAKNKHNPEIVQWLGGATINGVRLSASGSKVLINGKAYSVGDHAHYGLGIKVMVIEENRVLFIDKNGKRYVKQI